MSQPLIDNALPLTGVTVVDLSRALAGPYCTAMLADLGATVIKVESGEGDPTRIWPPFDGSHSLYFDSTNRNKQSIWLDLYTDEGKEVLDALLATADVLVENFKLGTLAKMGYDDDRLRQLNPRLLLMSITAYGEHGPLAAQPGLDQVIQARAGMTSVTGPTDGEGYRVGIPVIDIASGMTAAFTIAAMLLGRERGSQVRRGSTSLYETAVSMSVFQGQRAISTGEAAQRQGNNHPSITPYGVYRTKTDSIVVAVSTEKHFRDFAALLGHEEWLDDPRFSTPRERTNHREELNALINEALGARAAQEWIPSIQERGIPVGPILDYTQVMGDEQTRAVDLIQPATRFDGSVVSVVRGPVSLDGVPARVRTAPPALSQHASAILTEAGFSEERQRALVKSDVVRLPQDEGRAPTE